MSPVAAFLGDVTLTVLTCTGIVKYIQRHLRALLIELCGTAERANFWLAFCNVTMVLVPLIFVLGDKPEFAPGTSVIFGMAEQLKSALMGFVVTLGAFALVLLRYIPRSSLKAASDSAR